MSNMIEKQIIAHFVEPLAAKFKKQLATLDIDGQDGPDLPQATAHISEVTNAVGEGLQGANIPEVVIGVNQVVSGVKHIAAHIDIGKIQAALIKAEAHVSALARLGYAVFLKYAPKQK